ncbi:Ser/Thr protein kinase RdoA involved in Cpx stress response, MazF antagonist [Microbacterium sp. cf046]|uniref:phosphotransferase n=1 Tax=Microbacterium sp. cf046 TaxID=1761803 RepID=UPI0008EECC7C|nr:phosphotransferase [Microbacterium sp. cf046]SFR89944.1 Ser/Thr protein kinase RdoA involved in Cpx stress response, MazF antagonist [Microbacterium sp. cf046]
MADEIGGPPPMPADLEAAAASVVEREWRRPVSRVRRVSSDVEETFLVRFDDDREPSQAVLKIAEPRADQDWFAFEAAIVEAALRQDAELPLARGIPTPGGASIVEVVFHGSTRAARLTQLLPGGTAAQARPDAAARRRIGRTAGRLSLALSGVTHPVADRRVAWDLRDLDALAQHLPLLSGGPVRTEVENALAAHPALLRAVEHLPTQISHNDLNGGNILVSADDPGHVSGIIDFGDAAHIARVFDVGIAAAYAGAEAARERGAGAVWGAAAAMTLGYADIVPLTATELAVVPAIARARLAQRVLIAAGRREVAVGTPTRDDDAWLASAQRDLLAITVRSPADAPESLEEWR